MKEFEIESLREFLKEIEKKERNKNDNIEDITVEFFDGGLYVRSYIDDKLINKITAEFKILNRI